MAVRTIYTYPDPVLRRRAQPVTIFDDDLIALVDDMIETMYEAPGVGLAAPQVGISLRVCVIDTSVGEEEDALRILINPEIIEHDGRILSEEGCLSVPEFVAEIPRYEWVKVRFQGIDGTTDEVEGTELLGRALQHEIDHLNGVLFVDHLGMVKKERFKRAYRKTLEKV